MISIIDSDDWESESQLLVGRSYRKLGANLILFHLSRDGRGTRGSQRPERGQAGGVPVGAVIVRTASGVPAGSGGSQPQMRSRMWFKQCK